MTVLHMLLNPLLKLPEVTNLTPQLSSKIKISVFFEKYQKLIVGVKKKQFSEKATLRKLMKHSSIEKSQEYTQISSRKCSLFDSSPFQNEKQTQSFPVTIINKS